MSKRQKSFLGLDVLTKAILEQQAKISSLTEVKNSCLICVKQFQDDITELKSCLLKFKTAMNSKAVLHAQIPLSNESQPTLKLLRNYIVQFSITSQIPMNDVLCSVKYSKNGAYFAFSTYLKLFLYDANKNECIQAVSLPFDTSKAYEKATRDVVFSPDSKYLVVCAADFSIFAFNVPMLTHAATIQKSSEAAAAIAFFNDGKRLITTNKNGVINLWSLPQFELIKSVKFAKNQNIVSVLITNGDSSVIVLASNSDICFYDSNLAQEPQIVSAESTFVYSGALSRSSTYLCIAAQDPNAKLFNLVGKFRLEKNLVGHTDYIIGVEFSPDGKLVFTASKDETIRVWDVETGEMLATLTCHHNTVFAVSHHPTRNQIISCSGDGSICITSYTIVNK
ncbi:hypothetical protein TVAG_166880 [Trichomonas vaginalis G3]|uniref:Uncharacterized protein n=1 Tax=Trichomonas vaginalis (strain ATCC PRA-98 / G3) TaxID=412133 RepID=A2DE95_TRIV3|nr:WD repeat-containing protein family [Trichomonas vaginalis G3]EAY21313.1 hypothetical protein TVAG_166880 [Trichomonas vaginalis G3]KAI5548950.1 WD repeat-containing protein family [Trichomonas vaginalis G3]|eukprot:XP_001582299.1 hypothetical protein [Trichomonas vaginalis G3]